ncbi:SCO7613 C-terminal domain-containing membrane protein [Gulosibacter sp. ACHW.36C]|uniref:DUF2157 domain-containing protein n=1 Tax=Gulosibacter sediminis TaxID=1729695 RepID=A0ABY4N1Y3_9MICO|nr:hypothetical protein [Gulosibacter sediminis]UQN15518.1 hypothetical protein M3M28_03370 [Gulosibacter sediminis]
MDSGNDTHAPRFPESPQDLLSTTTCPYCFTPTHGAPRCVSCGLDLTNPRLAEVFKLSTSSAELLTQRGRILAEIRAEQDAQYVEAEVPAPPALPQQQSAPSPAPQGSIAGAWLNQPAPPLPQPEPRSEAEPSTPKRSGVQLAMLITGIGFLAVAALVFVTVAFVLFDLIVRAAITVAITAGVIALASWLRRRKLGATAEGVAVLGAVLLALDAWAIPALKLFGLDRADPALYWGVALLVLTAIFGAWWRWSKLSTPKLLASITLLPAITLLIAWLARLPLDDHLGWALGLATASVGSVGAARAWQRAAEARIDTDPLPVGISLALGVASLLLVPTVLGIAPEPNAGILVAILALAIAAVAAVLMVLWTTREPQARKFASFADIAAAVAAVLLLGIGLRTGAALVRALPEYPSGIGDDPGVVGLGFALPFLFAGVLAWRVAASQQPALRRSAMFGSYSAAALATIPLLVILLQLAIAGVVFTDRGADAPAHLALLLASLLGLLVSAVPLFWRGDAHLGKGFPSLLPIAAPVTGTLASVTAASLPGAALGAGLSVIATAACAGLVATRFMSPDRTLTLRSTSIAALASSLVLMTLFFGVGELLPTVLLASVACILLVARTLRPATPGLAVTIFAVVLAVVAWCSVIVGIALELEEVASAGFMMRMVTGVVIIAMPLVVGAAGARLELPRGESHLVAIVGFVIACTGMLLLTFDTSNNDSDWMFWSLGALFLLVVAALVAAILWDARGSTPQPTPRFQGTIALASLWMLVGTAIFAFGQPLTDEFRFGWGYAFVGLIVFGVTLLIRRACNGHINTVPAEGFGLVGVAGALAAAFIRADPDRLWPWFVFAIACATPLLARVRPDAVHPGWSRAATWVSAASLAVIGPIFVSRSVADALAVVIAAPTLLALAIVAIVAVVRASRYPAAPAQATIALSLGISLATTTFLADWQTSPTAWFTLALGIAAIVAAITLPARGVWAWARLGLAAPGGLGAALGMVALGLRSLDAIDATGSIPGGLASAVFVTLGIAVPLILLAPISRVLGTSPGIDPELRRNLQLGVWAAVLLTATIAPIGIAAANARSVDLVGTLVGVAAAIAVLAAMFRHTNLLAWVVIALLTGGAHAFFVATQPAGVASELPLVVAALIGLGALATLRSARPLLPLAAWLVLTTLPLAGTGLGLWWTVIAAGIPAVAVAVLAVVRFRRDREATPTLDLLTLLLPLFATGLTFDTDAIKVGLLLSAVAGLVAAFGITLPRPRTSWGPAARAGTAVATIAAVLWLWEGSSELAIGVPVGVILAAFVAGLWLLLRLAERASSNVERAGYAAAVPLAFTVAALPALLEHPLAAGIAAVVGAAAAAALVSASFPTRRLDLRLGGSGFGAVSIVFAAIAVAQDVEASDAWVLQPLCLAAAAVGAVALRTYPKLRSWAALGAPLIASLAIALAAEFQLPSWWRIGLATALIVAAILVGALLRLQAPLLIGIAAAVLHIVVMWQMFLPPIAVPWWAWLAAAGVVLVFVAATYEKRMRDARKLAASIGSLR